MPDFSERAVCPEIMDDLNCSGEVLYQTLRELEFINHWLGGNAVTIGALNALVNNRIILKPLRIADLGCGSGEMLRIISRWAEKRNIAVELTGVDANPNIIAYAANNLRDLSSARLTALDIFSTEFRSMEFDIVVGTLFFHHFSRDQLITFLSGLKSQVKIGIIINDIHRHFLAYYSIRSLTALFSKSTMVKNDAPLSVLRAFSRNELREIFKEAGLADFELNWKWAFRWRAVVRLNPGR